MSDYDDRGAYTPPSDRLAFDPRTPVRGGGPAPVTLIVSGMVLVGLVGGVFFLYRDGFKHRGEAPALVGAPVADARTPAAPPPAADNAAASLVVDKSTTPPPAPAFAPPPAQGLPAPPTQVATAPPADALPAPPVVASASPPVAAKPASPRVVMLAPDASSKPAAPPKQVAAAAPRHVVAPTALRQTAATAAAEHPVVRHRTMTIASLTDDALAHRPARAARAVRDDSAMRDDGATRQIRGSNVRFIDAPPPPATAVHRSNVRYIDAPPPAAPPARRTMVAARIKGSQFAGAAYAPAAPARAAAGPGSGWVQIGAFSSPSLADQGWRDIARLAPGAMAGKGKMVQPIDRDDGTTLYRTYVTGFASVTAAQSFCAELRASGKACMVK